MKQINYILSGLFLLMIVSSCSGQDHGQVISDTFRLQVEKERAQKDTEFRAKESSPLSAAEVSGFKHLSYYPYDLKYRVKARFELTNKTEVFKMKTTTDRLPEYRHYANVYFTIDGKEFKLEVFQNVELISRPGYENYLFLPYSDETSGRETYGGGRFIDLTNTHGEKIVIDFNKSYNPYCAYNHEYSCPLPPQQNDLSIKIEAGEKTYH